MIATRKIKIRFEKVNVVGANVDATEWPCPSESLDFRTGSRTGLLRKSSKAHLISLRYTEEKYGNPKIRKSTNATELMPS